MPIRAISLDLDDTLWSVGPVMLRAEGVLLDWLRLNSPRVAEEIGAEGLRELREDAARAHPHHAHDFTELRRISLRRAMLMAGHEDAEAERLAEGAFQAFFEARNRVELYPEVEETLEELSGRYRLGFITNGNADVEVIGLAHRFHFRVHAREAGCAKPDARIFQAALDHAGVGAAEMVHVGDDPEHDILGPAALGIRTVWVDRHGRGLPEGVEPDGRVETLAELPEVVRKIGN